MINFTITSSSDLPADFAATPQKFFEALLDRLTVEANSETWHDGDTQPSNDSGPWFKNGTQLYVWKDGDYNPVNTGDSITLQIFASPTEPDPTVYQYWLKFSGSIVVGLYYYMGTTTGWVVQNGSLAAKSVTTAKLADDSVTTSRIADNTVKSDNILGPIPTTKWEKGTGSQFLRMNLPETLPGWESAQFATNEIEFTGGTGDGTISYIHQLGVTPHKAELVFVCKEDEAGWVPGDEVPISMVYNYVGISAGYRHILCVKSPTRVFSWFAPYLGNISCYIQSKSQFLEVFVAMTPSKWRAKFYITAS